MNDQDLFEFRMSIYERDGFKCIADGCNVRGADNLEMGHRISKGKCGQLFVQRYLKERHGIDHTLKQIEERYIHHPFNIVSSCKKHNDNFNILNNPSECYKLIEKIKNL